MHLVFNLASVIGTEARVILAISLLVFESMQELRYYRLNMGVYMSIITLMALLNFTFIRITTVLPLLYFTFISISAIVAVLYITFISISAMLAMLNFKFSSIAAVLLCLAYLTAMVSLLSC